MIKLEKSSSCWGIVPLNVVPAPDEDWAVPPIEGRLEDGKIYGRGVQDMKSVSVSLIFELMPRLVELVENEKI